VRRPTRSRRACRTFGRYVARTGKHCLRVRHWYFHRHGHRCGGRAGLRRRDDRSIRVGYRGLRRARGRVKSEARGVGCADVTSSALVSRRVRRGFIPAFRQPDLGQRRVLSVVICVYYEFCVQSLLFLLFVLFCFSVLGQPPRPDSEKQEAPKSTKKRQKSFSTLCDGHPSHRWRV
jgi:hypothetical protein